MAKDDGAIICSGMNPFDCAAIIWRAARVAYKIDTR
jgi:hypothetical protein